MFSEAENDLNFFKISIYLILILFYFVLFSNIFLYFSKHGKWLTLWWSVNLSDNWAFNVWTVKFINTPTTINSQVNCNMLLFVLDIVHIVTGWSIHSHPHTRWYSQSRTFHTFLSYLYVYLSKAEYVSQSKFACIHANHVQLLDQESYLALQWRVYMTIICFIGSPCYNSVIANIGR